MTHVSAYDYQSTHFTFYLDNTPLTSINIHGNYGGSYTWDIGSADSVVFMKAGQALSIRHTTSEAHTIEGAWSGVGQSMFSGFLLREHSGSGVIAG